MSTLVILYAAHVLSAIVWFGGGLYSVAVIGPVTAQLSAAASSEFGPIIGRQAHKIMFPAATCTIVLGVILAVATGRLAEGTHILGTPYALTAIVALVLSLGVWLFGQFVIGRAARAIGMATPADRPAAVARAIRFIGMEQLGFLAIFSCMVLMRFGY